MPKPGEIRYCDLLGGRETSAAFVWIPPGTFWMGDKRESENPVHFTTITKGFWVQQTPLTVGQYRHTEPSNLPRGKITWDNVVDFCKGKPLRMPTEAEWEYAARANTGHKYVWAGSNVADNVAWTSDTSDDQVRLVAQLKSNNYKLFDMTGNTHEWCYDEYKELYSFPQVDPISFGLSHPGMFNSHTVRGPSIFDDLNILAISFRAGVTHSESFYELSVRLVWEI